MHHGSTPLTPAECLQRIRELVYLRDECRIWAGSVDGRGHPRVMWRGKRHAARLLMLRLAGRMRDNEPGRVAWTTCGDPLCMAERHIQFGSRADMARAMPEQQRTSAGLVHSLAIAGSPAIRTRAKMPMSVRHEVVSMRAAGATWSAIGRHYGITRTAARNSYLRWERLGLITWFPTREAA